MIRPPAERPTDYRAFEADLAELGSLAAVRDYYAQVIERHQALNERFQFTASFDEAYVYRQLENAWRLRGRELFGIPVGVKDIFNTAVLPTSMGSKIWEGFHAGNNARVVDEIADRGGVIFSKTTTAEFAVHYIQNGRTVNPHDPRRITGTSSAGSAVAVACGALPISLATQTAGSIVRPASFCGTFGFKPSFGAFDRTGTLKTTDTLDTIGLIGSDLYGLRKFFAASFQKDAQYPLARRYFEQQKRYAGKPKLNIGLIGDQFRGYSEYDSEVREDFQRTAGMLHGDGYTVEPIVNVGFINDIHPLHERIYCKALSYYFQTEAARGSQMSSVMRDMVDLGSTISVEAYLDALKQQPRYRDRFDEVFARYDFVITPSTASVAPPLGEVERQDTCLIWTYFGYPVLSLPLFQSASGLPFGLQVVAPKFCDLALLDFGMQLLGRLTGEGT
jgi:Asp-tRNA(Asn)/Glu-tRNA(Gln) amidotransferase A subunit family amidase